MGTSETDEIKKLKEELEKKNNYCNQLEELIKDYESALQEYLTKCPNCEQWVLIDDMRIVGSDEVCSDCIENGYGR